MALRIRRGTEAQRLGTVAELGELLWVTDQKKLYVGTGATNNPGNASMANILETSCGPGISWNATTQQIELGNFAISSDDVTEGINNKYFTPLRSQSATATLFANGAHTGISYVYNDVDDAINSTVSLSLNNLSNVNIVGTPTNGQVLKYDTATSKWVAGSDIDTDTGIQNVVEDLTPQLGGTLDLNGNGITGYGSFSVNTGADSVKTYGSSVMLIESIGITTGARGGFPATGINVSRGTLLAPTNTQAGDFLGSFAIRGLVDNYDVGAIGITGKWADDAIMSNGSPKSELILTTGDNNDGFNVAVLDGNGTFNAPILQPNGFTNTERDALTPVVGMIIYNTTINKFQGYQYTLGTTYEWVDLS